MSDALLGAGIKDDDLLVLELGVDGRLIALQLEELTAGTGPGPDVVLRDYLPDDDIRAAQRALCTRQPVDVSHWSPC